MAEWLKAPASGYAAGNDATRAHRTTPQVRILLPPQHFRDSDKRSDEIEISAPRNGRARSGDHRTNT